MSVRSLLAPAVIVGILALAWGVFVWFNPPDTSDQPPDIPNSLIPEMKRGLIDVLPPSNWLQNLQHSLKEHGNDRIGQLADTNPSGKLKIRDYVIASAKVRLPYNFSHFSWTVKVDSEHYQIYGLGFLLRLEEGQPLWKPLFLRQNTDHSILFFIPGSKKSDELYVIFRIEKLGEHETDKIPTNKKLKDFITWHIER